MNASRAAHPVLPLLPGLLLGLFTLPFVHAVHPGEPDLFRMVNGLLWGRLTGEGWEADFH